MPGLPEVDVSVNVTRIIDRRSKQHLALSSRIMSCGILTGNASWDDDNISVLEGVLHAVIFW